MERVALDLNPTTYPVHHALLQREMDKILGDAGRRERVKRVREYLQAFISAAPVKSTARTKAGRQTRKKRARTR